MQISKLYLMLVTIIIPFHSEFGIIEEVVHLSPAEFPDNVTRKCEEGMIKANDFISAFLSFESFLESSDRLS